MTTSSESLRSQVEKRIAELKEEMRTEAFGDELAEYRTGIHELEQVLTLIDEKAKELEDKAFTGKTFDNEKFITIQDALTLLVGPKELGAVEK